MDPGNASHGRIRRRITGLAKLMSSTWRVLDFSQGKGPKREGTGFAFVALVLLIGDVAPTFEAICRRVPN
ncbi:hypothetical protein NL676_033981 [Syzygium grande]|nr:hypothetical protein NL676_033981 [Syzygium grande]